MVMAMIVVVVATDENRRLQLFTVEIAMVVQSSSSGNGL